MFDKDQVPPVDTDEVLARFVIFSKHFRPSNMTVKPDAFIPHPLIELSVTRHRDAAEDELWREGERVAAIRTATRYGRADVSAEEFVKVDLSVVASPIPENPNHANVTKWPADKSEQKMKALEIANRSRFVPRSVVS